MKNVCFSLSIIPMTQNIKDWSTSPLHRFTLHWTQSFQVIYSKTWNCRINTNEKAHERKLTIIQNLKKWIKYTHTSQKSQFCYKLDNQKDDKKDTFDVMMTVIIILRRDNFGLEARKIRKVWVLIEVNQYQPHKDRE